MLDFDKYATIVIKRIEGGYFHPDMYKKDPGFFAGRGDKYNEARAKAYSQSGETMFGQDRAKGAQDFPEFWAIIDQYYKPYHDNLTYWNEKGGTLRTGKKSNIPSEVGTKLINLLLPQKKAEFNKYFNLNVKTEKLKNLILNDPGLFFQFVYATWNGAGRMQRFANVVETAWKNGTRNAAKLQKLVQQERVKIYGANNEVQSKTVPKIVAELGGSGGGNTKWLWLLAGGVAMYFILKRK